MGKKKGLGRSWYYLIDKKYKRRHLRFCTVIIGAIRTKVSEINDQDRKREIIKDAVDMFDAFRAQWVYLGRAKRLSGYTYRGEFEIDLRKEVKPGSHCYATLNSLGCDVTPLAKDERILVLHVHFVLDGYGVIQEDDDDGEGWAEQVRSVIRPEWPGSWRTQVKGLYATQTAQEAVRNLHGYCTKRVYAYYEGGYGDEKVKFTGEHEMIWMRLIVKIYGSTNGCKGTEFRSKK